MKIVSAFLIMFSVAGCCESRWCELDRDLAGKTRAEAVAKVSNLSDQELFQYYLWELGRTHPPSFSYGDLMVSRGRRMAPSFVGYMRGNWNDIPAMHMLGLLQEIEKNEPGALSSSDKDFIFSRCKSFYEDKSASECDVFLIK